MPKRSRNAKRTFKRRQRRRKRRGTVMLKNFLPTSRVIKQRYSTFITIDAPATTIASHAFRANDVYDPDYTGSGHQPLYFDELMELYNHFCVLGSKLSIKCINYNTAASDSIVLGLTHTGGTSPGGTLKSTMIENGKSQFIIVEPQTRGKGKGLLSRKFSTKKFFKTNPKDRSDLRGDVSNSPSEQAYFHIWVAGLNPSDNPGPVSIEVTIDYITLYTEPKTLAPS